MRAFFRKVSWFLSTVSFRTVALNTVLIIACITLALVVGRT